MSNPEDRKSYSKIAQIYNALRQDFTIQNIEKIILSQKDKLNYRIPSHSFLKSLEPALAGGTILQIALSRRSHEIVRLLLQLGVDYAIKNDDGSTALHYIATSDYHSLSDTEKLSVKPFIDEILSAHIASKNFVNPRNSDGLSHLHIACMVNHTAALKFFLSYGENVNQAIYESSSCNPGYTPLHFSVRCRATESIKIILDHGANVLLRDSKGMTPIDLLLEREMLVHDNINEELINLLLERIPHEKLIIDDVGLSRFHIACTSQDTSLVESILNNVDNINHSVSTSSQKWPGYTGLHFASRCNVNTVKMLLSRGADLEMKDALGVSPFDICLKKYEIKDIHAIVSQKSEWKDILLSDGNVRLTDLLFVMEYLSRLKGLLQTDLMYINAHIPSDSKIWPGYTPLHLAVMFSERHKNICTDVDSPAELDLDLIRECLTNGADVTIKDSCGSTPLILAYRQDKMRVVNLLLHCHHVLVNPADEDNLSHLHIACEAQNEILVENLLTRIGDVNIVYRGNKALRSIKPGYTPLHIAVAKKNSKIVEILTRHGAEINFADFNGCTPIHETLDVINCKRIAQLLFSSPALRVCVVNGVGLSHFHIASMFNCEEIIEELMTLGADIDGQIISDKFTDNSRLPDKFKGCTALHLAVMYHAEDVIMLLLHRKADILIKNDDGSTPLSKTLDYENRKYLHHFISTLKDDEELQSRMERETGMTMLHLACHIIDVDEVTELLRKGVNVNARVNEGPSNWAGCTPLHFLSLKDVECVFKYNAELHEKILVISEILLGNAADVSLTNKEGDSPIHEFVNLDHDDTRYLPIRQLIHYHADFTVNPINSKGISHFHLACMVNDVSAVEKFLQRGVDVNLPIDFFSDKYSGCYPIHMAIDSRSSKLFGPASQLETIDLLLRHGVDVCVENSYGYTALHNSARSEGTARKAILERICSAGADINSVSMYGETPFEILISTEVTSEEIRFFIEYNSHINSCNPNNERGYLSMLLSKKQHANLQTSAFEEMMKAPDIAEIDEMGHTAIHNIVTIANPNISTKDYIQLVKRLSRLECDIDDQDKSGRTALHLSAQFGNKEATVALLTSGADVNITDAFNKSAFSYAIEICRKCDGIATHRHEEVIKVLALHIHKLQLLELDVSQLNANLKNGMNPRIDVEEKFQVEVDIVSMLKIEETALVVGDFLKETKAVIDYPYLNLRDRNAINEFFDNINNREIEQLKGILMMQYRKALKRLQLIDLAVTALRSLLGFPMPDLCCEIIFKFLKNTDLKNLIESANDDM